MDFIEVYPNALPDEFCDELVRQFDNHSGVQAGRTGGGVDTSKKVSLDLMLDAHPDLAVMKNRLLGYTLANVTRYFDKYSLALMGAVAVNVAGENGESITLTPDNYQKYGKNRAEALVKYLYRSGTINIQKYPKAKGGYPHWHSEQFPQQGHNEALHRVVLYMFYLNDVEEGGETEFYYQNKRVKPKKGTMVIAPAGFTHSHRGNMPKSHDKYIATSWIMFNRAEQLYAAVK
ncbi:MULTISPECIES: 2OG-Fe(II) oxygenase [Shewanella]|uniref:2OG-Fe(II) oxygenase n=1 Tax=Shewanella fidelis TaxID=173509 RepID=A0AAW8NJX1_9GAMM|nr:MULTISPECIES: 2OG-Fe(II) oxygenase [Shewanella]MDR8523513.1 2OG-Fe(II) oxygenase [Shewanella fidelis]MDW4810060.1 2OG-Fe(II) oxygenase [Shewanella fidelis]MDW4814205.1 2OG-Fe(II) oxygenase [Shewanella fidelis]MDW4822236.1 2OG-Fe(II) oxygenase [Shewanella fidelis]MDW4826327.1 2OG-Fe(II) oxygenase [Shewanella fidelis]